MGVELAVMFGWVHNDRMECYMNIDTHKMLSKIYEQLFSLDGKVLEGGVHGIPVSYDGAGCESGYGDPYKLINKAKFLEIIEKNKDNMICDGIDVDGNNIKYDDYIDPRVQSLLGVLRAVVFNDNIKMTFYNFLGVSNYNF